MKDDEKIYILTIYIYIYIHYIYIYLHQSINLMMEKNERKIFFISKISKKKLIEFI